MPMHNVATGIRLDTRSLHMEILCSLPCGGGHGEYNGRTTWQRGVSIVELARDFFMTTAYVRKVLRELGERHTIEAAGKRHGEPAVRTGNVAPVMLPNGKKLRGGHCAFVDPAGWDQVQAACEAYQAEFDDG